MIYGDDDSDGGDEDDDDYDKSDCGEDDGYGFW